ncbi:hypothetical protein DPMN_188801 [Dreissena polymorpha]|uniref:Uncharacterized protein n=1 Tax=Dreissena polymorpha TaxID=45954 RepID=A0A9D4DT41_DREPO|nr:hypothetical protein DPMN_188801 [Dreissena polymorpha]
MQETTTTHGGFGHELFREPRCRKLRRDSGNHRDVTRRWNRPEPGAEIRPDGVQTNGPQEYLHNRTDVEGSQDPKKCDGKTDRQTDRAQNISPSGFTVSTTLQKCYNLLDSVHNLSVGVYNPLSGFTTFQTVFTTLQTVFTTLQTCSQPSRQCTTLQTVFTILQTVFITLQTVFTTLQTVFTTLQTVFTTLQTAFTTLQTVFTTFQPVFTTFQPVFANPQTTVFTTLQTVFTTFQPVFANIQTVFTTLQPVFKTLQTVFTTLQPVFANLQPCSQTSRQYSQLSRKCSQPSRQCSQPSRQCSQSFFRVHNLPDCGYNPREGLRPPDSDHKSQNPLPHSFHNPSDSFHNPPESVHNPPDSVNNPPDSILDPMKGVHNLPEIALTETRRMGQSGLLEMSYNRAANVITENLWHQVASMAPIISERKSPGGIATPGACFAHWVQQFHRSRKNTLPPTSRHRLPLYGNAPHATTLQFRCEIGHACRTHRDPSYGRVLPLEARANPCEAGSYG